MCVMTKSWLNNASTALGGPVQTTQENLLVMSPSVVDSLTATARDQLTIHVRKGYYKTGPK